MRYIVAILIGMTLFISCDTKKPNHEHRFHENMKLTMEQRDSIHEERKKKRLDHLTEKLELSTSQLKEIKALEESFSMRLKESREQMMIAGEAHKKLMEAKKNKMEMILTSEQAKKMKEIRKKFKRRVQKNNCPE